MSKFSFNFEHIYSSHIILNYFKVFELLTFLPRLPIKQNLQFKKMLKNSLQLNLVMVWSNQKAIKSPRKQNKPAKPAKISHAKYMTATEIAYHLRLIIGKYNFDSSQGNEVYFKNNRFCLI